MEKDPQSFFDRFNAWIMDSVTLKLIIIGIMVLLLLIPVSMVTNLVSERQTTSESVVLNVSADWGNAQTIKGPVLVVPYNFHTKEGKKTRHVVFLPDELNINGQIMPQERKRGIYKVIVYGSQIEISGVFNQPAFNEWNISQEDILFDDAYLLTGISDLRGIKQNITLYWGSGEKDFESGFDHVANTGSGIRANVKVNGTEQTYPFKYLMNLNGSQSINFVPVGKVTNVRMSSNWRDPSFTGAFLPEHYDIDGNGFSSTWKVLHFNRDYPQRWLSEDMYNLEGKSVFGVNLLQTVDHYQKNYRSARYAILIISLSFLMFFLIEILSNKKIHPFNYAMVGIALCVFYSLLLSLSEHIGFGFSYLISSIVIVLLISFYLGGILGKSSAAFWIPGILSLLYIYIFIILQLQDYALLAGSIGLLAALGAVMVLSRKINWYEPKNTIAVRSKLIGQN
jgi:inner membrane protein